MMVKQFLFLVLSIALISGCKGGTSEQGKEYSVTTLLDLKTTDTSGVSESSKSANSAMSPEPAGITIFENSLFFTDSYNHTVCKLDLQTRKWEIIAGTFQVKGENDGMGKLAKFNYPFGLANDGKYLYVADSGNSLIRQIDMRNYQVSTLMGKANVAGARDGDQQTGLLRHPYGLAIDGSYLYIADSGNATIRRINLKKRLIKTVTGISGVAGKLDGPKGTARFNSPRGLVVNDKYIFVSDTINGSIRRVDKVSGEVTTLAGYTRQPGSSDGTGTSARFNNPASLALMGNNLVIADMQNSMVRKVSIDDAAVTTIAGKGNVNPALDMLSFFPCVRAMSDKAVAGYADGKASEARFNFPWGIFADGSKIYVSDMKNHAIRILE